MQKKSTAFYAQRQSDLLAALLLGATKVYACLGAHKLNWRTLFLSSSLFKFRCSHRIHCAILAALLMVSVYVCVEVTSLVMLAAVSSKFNCVFYVGQLISGMQNVAIYCNNFLNYELMCVSVCKAFSINSALAQQQFKQFLLINKLLQNDFEQKNENVKLLSILY